MPLPQYLPHVLYSIALTSISVHLLTQRRTADTQRAQLTAQISILESIVEEYRHGKPVSDGELERLRRLAQAHAENEVPISGSLRERIGWKDVILGRKASKTREAEGDALDQRDLEQLRQEIENAKP